MTINGRGYVTGGRQGSLNLTVVSGLTKPANPENNTIWLNSELPVHGIYIAQAQVVFRHVHHNTDIALPESQSGT